MDNQHRKIKGYRELTQAEIDLMNKIKEKAAEVGELVAELEDWAGGYYCPKTFLPVDSDERPIDIKRVFPSRDACEEFTIEALEYGALAGTEKDARPLEYVRVPDSVAVARGYFLDAINGAETGPIFYAPDPNHAQKLVGDGEFGDWVVMGLRV